MTLIAPHITTFLRERLPNEKRASAHTTDTYAYAFQLLFGFMSRTLVVAPSDLQLEQLDADMVLAFLTFLESDRGNSPRTRNARLAAIKSFMKFIEYRVPSALEQVRRVLAIPLKKTDTRLVSHLTLDEMQAVLDSPDPSTRDGVRDRAMLHLAFATGVRVSELIGLCLEDLSLQPLPTILIHGKGRRERSLPLWKETATALRAWLAIRGEAPVPEIFLSSRGENLTRAGFEYILRKHVKRAGKVHPAILRKRVSPHVLRHTCAMVTLRATGDIRKVALWLGHASIETTEIYLQADPTDKMTVLERVKVPKLRRGSFRPPDKLIASLKPPGLCRAESRSSPVGTG